MVIAVYANDNSKKKKNEKKTPRKSVLLEP